MFSRFRKKFIGSKAFYSSLLVLLIPIVIQQGITNFVSLLDNVMVGRLGTESMSGVAIVNQLIFVFNITLFGGYAGASIYGAQFFGKGDHDGVRYAFRVKFIFGMAVTAAAIGLLYFFDDQLISMFLTDDGSGSDLPLTLSEGKRYLHIILIGLFPYAFSQMYASSLRENGETVAPMVASCIAIVLNTCLNLILIFGYLGAPKMGVAGAAVATVISRYAEAAYLMWKTWAMRDKFKFINGAFKSLYVPSSIVKNILKTGTPLIANEIMWSVGITMITQSYSVRGLQVVAAMNIATTVSNLFSIVLFSMGQAISIMVGQLLGAGQIKRAISTDNKLIFFSIAVNAAIGLLIVLVSSLIPEIYNTEPEVKALTTKLLIVIGLSMPVMAYAHATYFTLRSGGKTFITFLFDSVFTWLVPLPIAFCLCRFTALPVVVIFVFDRFSDTVKCIIGTLLLRSGVWANNIVADEE